MAPGRDPQGGDAAAIAEPVAPALPPRLVDLASDWLALVPALRACPDLPDAARLRERVGDGAQRHAHDSVQDDAAVQQEIHGVAALRGSGV